VSINSEGYDSQIYPSYFHVGSIKIDEKKEIIFTEFRQKVHLLFLSSGISWALFSMAMTNSVGSSNIRLNY
jgi:hypothetical protein